MSRYACKKDSVHNDIADGIRKAGWSVLDLFRAGGGVPDLACGKPGIAVLVELKSDDKAKLTPKEQDVRDNWTGPYVLASTLTEALAGLALYG